MEAAGEAEVRLLLQEARESIEAARSYRRELQQRLRGLHQAREQVGKRDGTALGSPELPREERPEPCPGCACPVPCGLAGPRYPAGAAAGPARSSPEARCSPVVPVRRDSRDGAQVRGGWRTGSSVGPGVMRALGAACGLGGAGDGGVGTGRCAMCRRKEMRAEGITELSLIFWDRRELSQARINMLKIYVFQSSWDAKSDLIGSVIPIFTSAACLSKLLPCWDAAAGCCPHAPQCLAHVLRGSGRRAASIPGLLVCLQPCAGARAGFPLGL